jgi:hypothetical protein
VKRAGDSVGRRKNSFRGMQDDMAERRPILQTLFDVYDFDTNLENDMSVMNGQVPAILVWYTTQEERRMVAKWVREAFDLDIDWHAYDVGEFKEEEIVFPVNPGCKLNVNHN